MRKSILAGIAAFTLLLFATPLFAGFATSVTGNGALVAPPASAVADTSTLYQVWNESQGTLSTTFSVENNGAPGSYNGLSPGTSTTLTSGTPYGTTLVQLNPGLAGTVHSGFADITFSSKIIGIALRGVSLDATDIYGHPGTVYPTGYGTPSDNRGIDFRTNDRFTILSGGTELKVGFTTNNFSLDEIRVFTAGSATSGVPEPASLVVWSLVGIVVTGGSWWRRQRPAI